MTKEIKWLVALVVTLVLGLFAAMFIVRHYDDAGESPPGSQAPTQSRKVITPQGHAAQHNGNSSTLPTTTDAKIEWSYVGNSPLVRYQGELFYQLREGFFAEVPKNGDMDSKIRVFVPRQFRTSGEYAAKAAAVATCDVETFVGSKTVNLYDGTVVGYQFELKSGSNLLVIPTNRLLESMFMVQTVPGREPIIGIGDVGAH